MLEQQYDYRPRWTTIIFCGLFFAACAIVLGAKGSGNEHGLILFGMVKLSPASATIYYWVMTGTSVGFVALALFLAVFRLTCPRRIAFCDGCLIIPRSAFSAEEVTVPFSNILEVSAYNIFGQRSLKIIYTGGKFTMAASMLPRKRDFDEIHGLLKQANDERRPQHL